MYKKEIMHCVEFDNKLSFGGSIKYAYLLDKGLRQNGFNTIQLKRPPLIAGKIDKNFITGRIYIIFALLKIIFGILKDWIEFTSSKKLWIIHHPFLGFFSLFSRRYSLIYICHGPWYLEAKDILDENFNNNYIKYLQIAFRRIIQKVLIIRCDKLFFISSYMRNLVLKDLNLDNSKINRKVKIISPIVDNMNKITEKDYKTATHERKKGKIYICRRLVKRTGVTEFVNLWRVSNLSDNNVLEIAGTGPESKNLEKLLTKYQKINCNYRGFLSEEDHIKNYLTSEFMILPSKNYEGFGLVIVEAIKYGCIPIVSNKSGGGAEWLRNICHELIYDGSMKDLENSISWARKQNRNDLMNKLRKEILIMNAREVAKNLITNI